MFKMNDIARRIKFCLLFGLLILAGCSGGLPELGDSFDSEEWKNDELACGTSRQAMLNDVLNAKEELVQLGEAEIRRLFGKPDNVELFSRSQKFYLYYVEAGGQCEGKGGQVDGQMLELSLDALGRIHEINIRMDRKSIEN